jgi:subtilase family serine protease
MIRRITLAVGLCVLLGATTLGGPASATASRHARFVLPHLAGTRRACAEPTPPGMAACMAIVGTTAGGTPDVSPSLPQGYGPTQFHTAYNLPTTAGTPQTIAIVDAFSQPNIYSDLATYDSTYGLPAFPTCASMSDTGCFLVLNQSGGTSSLPVPDTGWGLEISMDVEVAHAICQDCRINLYEANTSSFSDLAQAENEAVSQGADVVSNSYGDDGKTTSDCAASVPTGAYNHPGVAITVSAGDDGFGRSCPAVLNTVISVGGTTLNLNSDSTWKSETVWNGTGAGCSQAHPARSFQTALGSWKHIGCPGRGMNDLAADANPNTGAAVYDSDYGGWLPVGGTSLSAPMIGAAYALAHNASTWTYPARSGYDTRTGFRDVVAGGDGPCPVPVRCRATGGYDLPTGVGTPNGLTGL